MNDANWIILFSMYMCGRLKHKQLQNCFYLKKQKQNFEMAENISSCSFTCFPPLYSCSSLQALSQRLFIFHPCWNLHSIFGKKSTTTMSSQREISTTMVILPMGDGRRPWMESYGVCLVYVCFVIIWPRQAI